VPSEPRTKKTPNRLAVLGAALGLAFGAGAAACGGGGGGGGSSNAAGGSATTGGAAPQYGSEEFGLTLDELATRIEQVEGLIGECMTQAGFEYVPVDFERVKEGMDADKSAPGLSDEEFVAQYGYGITTLFERPGREIGLGEQNIQIYEGLSPAEQTAYNHTLFGDNTDATLALTIEAEDFSQTGGCTRQAVEESFTPDEMSSDYFNPGDALMEQDKRMVAAIAAWTECVAAEGHEYGHPDDVEDDLKQRLDELTQGTSPESLTGAAADELAQLQGEELALAAVSTQCEADHIEPVAEEIEAELYGAPQN
jgi:hypothetical protein